MPKDYFNETEELTLPSGDPPNDIVDFLLGIVKSKINELATTLVENGPNTIDRIKKSKDVDKYRKKMEGDLTIDPLVVLDLVQI